jgi:DNA polymerase III epsilon subunit-like protein
MIKPFTDNFVFIDTEFSDLNPYKGELISIGMVKQTGEELYLELEYDGEVSAFVTENVLPKLTGNKISREQARKEVREFLCDSKPYLMGFINQYDDVYLSKLFLGEEKPYTYAPLDLATLLFFHEINPLEDVERTLGIDLSPYREHHALDDAKWVRDVYEKLKTLKSDDEKR